MDPCDPVIRLGLLVPSTNRVAEEELGRMCPSSVSLHGSRYAVGSSRMDSEAAVEALLDVVDAGLARAAELLAQCDPQRVIHIMSAHSFSREVELTLPVTDGPTAFRAAFEELGVTRVALLSPYHRIVEEAVQTRFEASGAAVVESVSLNATSTASVSEVAAPVLADAIQRLADAKPDAIAQIGGNLRFARFAAGAEQWLGIPVLAANTTLMWHALRSVGVRDRVVGWGTLLESR
jgi:maleate isomerase